MSNPYIGIDGLARKIIGGYIGIDGVARKIKKMYIGIDGVASLCWENAPAQMWETLFEGEVVTVCDGDAGTAGDGLRDYSSGVLYNDEAKKITKGEGLRLTIDGSSYVYTVVGSSLFRYAGNRKLDSDFDSEYEDDGNPICIGQTLSSKMINVYTRNPGTYQIKVERALFAPVAYLYNGVRLPKLPDYDKIVYPYSLIYADNKNPCELAYLYLSTVPLKVNSNILYNNIYATADGSAIVYIIHKLFGVISENWERSEDDDFAFKQGDKAETTSTYDSFKLRWANYSVSNYDDDSEYLAASEPVPVYE